MAENWIEEATEEILIESKIGWTSERKKIEAIILSHAPVIDAEKIAEKLFFVVDELYLGKFIDGGVDKPMELIADGPTRKAKTMAIAKMLISDSIDLNIDWVDGRAEWGVFSLFCWMHANEEWHWDITTGEGGYILDEGEAPNQESAIEACKNYLKRIITGVSK